jgi:putative phosphoesterase
MKIAVLSDSHRKPELTIEALRHLKSIGATYIVHAGDLEIKENLDILKNSKLPYVCVFGNNDNNLVQYQNDYNIQSEPYYFKIKEEKFKLMHLPFYMTPDSSVVISGHTHIFEQKFVNNTLFLNPGEVCARDKPLTQCALLEITENEYIITYNYKKPQEKIWNKEEFKYER